MSYELSRKPGAPNKVDGTLRAVAHDYASISMAAVPEKRAARRAGRSASRTRGGGAEQGGRCGKQGGRCAGRNGGMQGRTTSGTAGGGAGRATWVTGGLLSDVMSAVC